MADLRAVARRKARRHGLDPGVFERQIQQESGFQRHVSSPAGARGVAQIMPATARGWGVDPDKPRQALDAAAKHMAGYVKQFGSYDKALRAYNAGPGNVERSKGFSETNNYVRTILAGRHPSARGARARGRGGSTRLTGIPGLTRVTKTITPAVSNRAARGQLVASFLQDKSSDVLDFATELRALKDIPRKVDTSRLRVPGVSTSLTRGGGPGVRGGGGGPLAQTATQRARIINRQRLPYSWGGGHGGQTPIRSAVPLDCSGAVSKVLGINPRVSGQFSSWGKPGDGGNRGVTIYSNPHHVLMKINGRFFGTSASNPGGGAGWIPQSAVGGDYLKGFTARHRNG